MPNEYSRFELQRQRKQTGWPTRSFRRKSIPVSDLGKLLFVTGLVLAVVGLLLWTGVGKGWLGKLPGDINYTKGNFSFHFPLVTCILLSLLLTLILWLFRK